MIESLKHMPRPRATHEMLAGQFGDLEPALTPRQAALESARCLYCYDAPCSRICPTEIDVAGFIRNIHEGNVNGAAAGILKQNILGGSCARVCPTEVLCEDVCVRNGEGEEQPVRIGMLQRYAIDNMRFASHPFARAASTGKTVAVVGAGPAGLSCAHRLAMLGHDVVIYEAREKAGGLNEYGIARYKLTDDFAQKEVAFLLAVGGIRIEHGQTLGRNLHLDALRARHDAVFLALGLAASHRLGLHDVDPPGLLPAVDYIAALRQTGDLSALPLPARVIVIGAGNTAIDMAVQIRRLGAEEVTLVYRRGLSDMSATGHELELAKAHQVRLRTWAQPNKVLLNEAGQVVGMRFEKTRVGRMSGTGETFELAADAVFKAIGQSLDLGSLTDPLAGALSRERDKIAVDESFRTTLPFVYAGGDCVAPGQDLTVQAVQHGKLAALTIDQDIQSKTGAASWPI